ncbi:MAG: NAD(P)-dependent alcohol dehydrogenase [Phyllobacterium sp.]
MAMALVLEKQNDLRLREIALDPTLGPADVRIKVDTVGICGSDVHYYRHGRIGPFIVEAPMVLGHEAAGTVIEVGASVTTLALGDRVCMEPGVPDLSSVPARLGIYNLDPALTFWATPPIHGCLTPEVVHPAAFCYRLPAEVSMAEGAMVEPLAVGLQAANKAALRPGDTAVVLGAGPIGILVALSALAGGCSRVFLCDLVAEKLEIARKYSGIIPIVSRVEEPAAVIARATQGWGADVIFECSGAAAAFKNIFALARPGGTLVCVGMPIDPVPIDIVSAQAKEIRIETVFRYANVYDRAIALIQSGRIDLKPLISETFPFSQSVEAFDRAASALPRDIKLQIRMDA